MAVNVYKGLNGVLQYGATPDVVANCTDWTLTNTQNTQEFQVMCSPAADQSTQVVQYLDTTKTWNLAANLYWDHEDPGQLAIQTAFEASPQVPANVRVYPSVAVACGATTGDDYFEGSCIIGSYNMSSTADGIVTMSITFQARGPLTWDTEA